MNWVGWRICKRLSFPRQFYAASFHRLQSHFSTNGVGGCRDAIPGTRPDPHIRPKPGASSPAAPACEMHEVKGVSVEQSAVWPGGATCGLDRLRRDSHRALAEGFSAAGAEILVKLTGGQDQEKALSDRLGFATFRTVEFAGRESSKLFPHGCG
jgi:hypothetical protein